MGKILCKNTSGLIVLLITFIFLFGNSGEASFREFQVFDQAYHYYLSYQPEKAAEQFRAFLDEFPESSARDAAIFWLGKSLLQMRSIEEATRTFTEVKTKYPESPYNRYIAQAMEDIGNGSRTREQQALSVEERSRADALEHRIRQLEEREKYILNSAAVLDCMGVREVPWRSNNIIEDIENETMLYEEAMKRNIGVDTSQLTALAEFYSFNQEQTDYLRRYLVICRFLSESMKNIFDRRDVELLTINYQTYSGGEDTSVLASRLQMQLQNGMSLQEIHLLYPRQTDFSRFDKNNLQGAVKDKASHLQDGETGVFWTEDGFMIMKVIGGVELCGPDKKREERDSDTIRFFLQELTGERKRENHATAVREEK